MSANCRIAVLGLLLLLSGCADRDHHRPFYGYPSYSYPNERNDHRQQEWRENRYREHRSDDDDERGH